MAMLGAARAARCVLRAPVMRNHSKSKLVLKTETIKSLDLDQVHGGRRKQPKLPVHSVNPSCGIICFFPPPHTPPLKF